MVRGSSVPVVVDAIPFAVSSQLPDINVGNDRLRLEHHAVVVLADVLRLYLLDEVGHVVGQAEVMLLEPLGRLAGDRQLATAVVVAE